MGLYSERYGIRAPQEKTYSIEKIWDAFEA